MTDPPRQQAHTDGLLPDRASSVYLSAAVVAFCLRIAVLLLQVGNAGTVAAATGSTADIGAEAVDTPSDAVDTGDSVSYAFEVTDSGPDASGQITVNNTVTTGSEGIENYLYTVTLTEGDGDSGTSTDISPDLDIFETSVNGCTANQPTQVEYLRVSTNIYQDRKVL